jgi:hypothetical protein
VTPLSDRVAETQVLTQSAGPISICGQTQGLRLSLVQMLRTVLCEAIPYQRTSPSTERRFPVYTGGASISNFLCLGLTLLKPSHRVQFRIAALVALAFLIAQMGAIAHAYIHEPTPETPAHQQRANSHELCGDCLNFAPLLSAAGTPALLPFSLQHSQSEPPSAAPSSFRRFRTYLAFRSRAPPVTR